jgi:RHS repeat-associated protein
VDGKQGTSDDASAVAFSEYEHYDSRGRKLLHISFEGVHEQNLYDDKTGRLTEIRYYPNASAFANGTSSEVRKFSFDNRGRTNKIEHFVGGVSTRIETMEFDDDGRLYETMNPEGKVRYTYDVQGRMTRKEWSSTAFMPTGVQAFENTVNYTYDELGRLKTVVQRDRGGVTLGTSDVTAYKYTLDGLLDTTRYHNGIIHDNDYDSLGRLKTLTHWRDLNADGKQQSSENLASFDYTVRADGKRTKVVESIKNETNGVITEVLSKEFTWEYDAVDRLISETLVDEPFSQPPTRVYDLDWIYDLAGNRRMQTKSLPNETGGYAPSEVTTYAYDANDRLTAESVTGDSQSTTTYSFDKTQQSGKQSTQSGITTTQTFGYDLQGLLASVTTTKTNGSNPTKTVYRYDSTGIRVESSQWTAPVGDPTAFSLQSKSLLLTDTQNHTGYSQVLQETTYEGGLATKKVIYTIGHDQISQTILLPLPNGGEGWGEGATHWFGTDGHGSVRVLYDLAAAIAKDLANAARLQVYTFDAYGNLQGWPTSSLTPNTLPLTTYLYSGESFDFNIGQQYLRARFYDATTGRFNRLDPFAGNSSDPQSFHKYAYVHGDPIQGIDPTGMFLGSLGGMAGMLQTTLSVGFAGLGALNTVHSLVYSINAYQSWLEGDTWETIFNTGMSLLHGMAAALDFMTAVSILKIPPPPPLGIAVSAVGTGGNLVVRAMVLNPVFESWLITNVVPAVAAGIGTSGLLLATRHEMDWEIRGSNGRIRTRGHESSGGTSTGTRPTRSQQQSVHTERKFIDNHGDKVAKGDIVTMRGTQEMCKPGNPASAHGTGAGCQPHMQWFAKVKECYVYYTDALGKVMRIRPNGDLVKPDGTIVPPPTTAPR